MAESWRKGENLCNKTTLEHNLNTSLSHCRMTAARTDAATHFAFISVERHCYNSLQTQVLEGWVWQQAVC